ncbi:MAG: polymerase III subunit beta protein [Parcubacteria group bacterium GW2011_GWF2_46_8]|nr:MAG: polymerase III subunit beta protein [Parcubacteria group bacterium GW2011_GWF1_45_5]KKU47420.1 MAG: polymerase III subunit beta protein [Parcubacteria group bacterium GW2011_GWF2_46_8]
MKFLVLVENLRKALSLVEHALGKNAHLPILESFCIVAKGSTVSISATNLEIGMVTSCSAKIEKEGTAAVAARPLLNFLQQLNEAKVTIEQKEKTVLVTSDSYTASLQTYEIEEFPLIPVVKGTDHVQIESSLFAHACEQVSFASSTSDFRPELNSVCIRTDPQDGIRFVGTDTFRLAEKYIATKECLRIPEAKQSLLVPLRTIQEVTRIAKEKLEPLTILSDPTQASFEWSDTRMVSRLVEGEFPEYSSVIPSTFKIETLISHPKFLEALKVSGVFSSRLHDVRFSFDPKEKTITILATDALAGENRANFRVDKCKGESLEASFNYRYLIDALGALNPKSKIIFNVSDTDRPALIQEEGDGTYFCIIMPLRV